MVLQDPGGRTIRLLGRARLGVQTAPLATSSVRTSAKAGGEEERSLPGQPSGQPLPGSGLPVHFASRGASAAAVPVHASCSVEERLRPSLSIIYRFTESAPARSLGRGFLVYTQDVSTPLKIRMGSYQLGALLGSGAMGEVYRARDLKLDRDVAVKVLRPEVLTDPERLQRFEREARSASSLNHPSIVHIYDVGHSGQTPYLAMELVEGRTLREVLAGGRLSAAEALEIAVPLAEGLAEAHALGIVHRDLKPENVMLADAGFVKILDFGLAKLTAPDSGTPALATQTGAILGTAGYMSPEQARGEKVDHRADQFSFGLILYELATGRRAFDGETFAETLVAILRTQPVPVSTLAPETPAALRRLIDRCLAKRVEERYPSTKTLAAELRALRSGSFATHPEATPPEKPAGTSPGPFPFRRWIWPVAGGAALLAALAWLPWPALRKGPSEGTGHQVLESGSLDRPRLRLLAASRGPQERVLGPALSADGKALAFLLETGGRRDLYLRRTVGGDRVRLTDDDFLESSPEFSPDGERIVFTRLRPGAPAPEVCVMPVLGGVPRKVLDGASMASWSPDGKHLVFILRRADLPIALAVAGDDGSDLRILLEADGRNPFLYNPDWSPDGTWIALRRSTGGVAGDVWLVAAEKGSDLKPRRLTAGPGDAFEHHPRFTPEGDAVVFSSNRSGATNLWRQPLDGGPAKQLTSGPGPDEQPSVAANGAIAFLNSTWSYSLRLVSLADWEERILLRHQSFLWAPSVAPAMAPAPALAQETARPETAVAYSQAEADGSWQLWVVTGSGEPRQLTNAAAGAVYPRFMPDGKAVIYNTWQGPQEVLRQSLEGSPPEVLVSREDGGGSFADVAPDGRRIAFVRNRDGAEHLVVKDLVSGLETALSQKPGSVPRWSPDGHWIAFARDRSWDQGIFVVASDGSGERRLTETGGWPAWFPDGKRIGYLARRVGGSQEIRTASFPEGSPLETLPVPYASTNHPIDLAENRQLLATTDSEPLSDEIWLLD